MIILMFAGGEMFGTPFDIVQTPLRNPVDPVTGADGAPAEDGGVGAPTDRLRKDTLCFHTFMLMNIINMINCRVVKEDEDNVFKTLGDNKIFWVIFLLEMLIQNTMVGCGAF